MLLCIGEPWVPVQPHLCWVSVSSATVLTCCTVGLDSSSSKQTTPIPATGQSCTPMAKETNRLQQFEATGLLFLSGDGGCIQGFSLNMVTYSLHGHVAVAACCCRLPAKLKKTRRMLLPTLPHGSAFLVGVGWVCVPPQAASTCLTSLLGRVWDCWKADGGCRQLQHGMPTEWPQMDPFLLLLS